MRLMKQIGNFHIESKVRKEDKVGQYLAVSFIAKDTALQFRISEE